MKLGNKPDQEVNHLYTESYKTLIKLMLIQRNGNTSHALAMEEYC